MSEAADLGDLLRFGVGALGPAGRRVFLLQCEHKSGLLTLKIEKQQVAVLAEYLGRLLAELGRPAAVPEEAGLIAPSEPDWVAGTLGVSYDEGSDRIVLVVEELVAEDEVGRAARFTVTREQAGAFAVRATSVVAAGRPPCPICGMPLDPSGHACPRTNGHRPPAT
jgi:uncharacterized repeat protein (TIGR03847 family)